MILGFGIVLLWGLGSGADFAFWVGGVGDLNLWLVLGSCSSGLVDVCFFCVFVAVDCLVVDCVG